ncbi:MAG: DUF5711 family protein [Ruminococcus sp.]|nr:DUF5711 family protein [Ruminococcus sp.]
MSKHGINENKKKNKKTKTKAYRDTAVKKAKTPKQNKQRRGRKTVSYENVPIDEYREYSQNEVKFNKSILKKTLIIFGIIVVLVLSVTLFVNRDNITWDNFTAWFSESVIGSSKGEGYPTEIMGTTVSKGNFKLIGGRACYASDTSYVELSDTGGKIINSQLSFSNPVVRGTQNYSIVYGLSSNGFLINDAQKTKHKGTTKKPIFTADVNNNGDYCIVTEGSGYLSVLIAYSKDNEKKYEYSFADYYITCVSINDSGTGAVCCGVTTVNGAEHSKVYVLDFTSEKPVREYEFSESVIYDSFYLSDHMVGAVANNAVYFMDFDSDTPAKTEYNSRTLKTYDYNPATKNLTVALSRSGDGRNCDILFFNSSGENEYTIKSDYRVDSICTYKGTLGILSEGTAYILEEDGNVDASIDAGNDAQAILLYDTDKAYILGISEIRDAEFD